MPAIPKHRQPILDAAVALFRTNGYAGTALSDIIAESGAPKGSLYHYFPKGKAALAAAAVEEAGQRVVATLTMLAEEHACTADMVRAHARLLAGWMRASGFQDGCPVTTVMLALAPRERAIAAAGRKAYEAQLGLFRDKLVRDGFPEAQAGRLALLCISSTQGALIQTRIQRREEPLLAVADELAALIRTTRP